MKPTKTQRTFINADFSTRVQLAVPVAQRKILHGVSAAGDGDSDLELEFLVRGLVGHAGPAKLSDADSRRFVEFFEAAYAVGVAVGSQLRPDALTRGPR